VKSTKQRLHEPSLKADANWLVQPRLLTA